MDKKKQRLLNFMALLVAIAGGISVSFAGYHAGLYSLRLIGAFTAAIASLLMLFFFIGNPLSSPGNKVYAETKSLLLSTRTGLDKLLDEKPLTDNLSAAYEHLQAAESIVAQIKAKGSADKPTIDELVRLTGLASTELDKH